MSLFVVTNTGLAAAAAASPTGPYVHITGFRLGDNATTAASPTDTNLIGTQVYSGGIASYSYYDPQTIQINLEVPSSVGPFNYGEIALDMTYGGTVMFARFSYGTLRSKIASSLSGYSNSIRIKALIRMTQGPAIFSFATGVPQTLLELSGLNVLQTPTDHTDSPMIIVHEPNDYQESLLVHKHTGTLWSVDNYVKIGTSVVSAAADTTHVTAPLFSSLYMAGSGNNGKYLIQSTGGYMRSVSGLSGSTATLASSMVTSSLVGTAISIYQLASTLFADMSSAISALNLAKVATAGDTMTGLLRLSGNAVAALGAVPLQQVLPKAGGVTMTGQYNLSADATTAMQPITKQQLDAVSSRPGITGGLTDTNSITLPTGHIIKYGSYHIGDFPPNNQIYPYTFPIPFPNTCFMVIPGIRDEGGNNVAWISYRLPTANGFSFMINEAGNDAQDITFTYIAIGW